MNKDEHIRTQHTLPIQRPEPSSIEGTKRGRYAKRAIDPVSHGTLCATLSGMSANILKKMSGGSTANTTLKPITGIALNPSLRSSMGFVCV